VAGLHQAGRRRKSANAGTGDKNATLLHRRVDEATRV
jgi:hypothetical protein